MLSNILIAAYFLGSSYQDVKNKKDTVKLLTDRELPSPDTLFLGVVAWKIIFGLGLLFHPTAILSCFALIVFMLARMFLFRNFWNRTGKEKESAFRLFIMDMAIVGGLVALI